MTKLKKIPAIALAVCLCLCFAACSATESSSSDGGSSVRSDTSSTAGVESLDNSTSGNSRSQTDEPETANLTIIDKHGDTYTLSKEPVNVRTYQYGTGNGPETMYEYHITADTVITLPDTDQVYEARSILDVDDMGGTEECCKQYNGGKSFAASDLNTSDYNGQVYPDNYTISVYWAGDLDLETFSFRVVSE